MGDLRKNLPSTEDSPTEGAEGQDKIIDYDAVVKRIVAHETEYPSCKDTPYFNHQAFFSNLKHYQAGLKGCQVEFGKHILYGEVVTSTNTMLEK
jgi:biotin--protein ligase